MSETDSPIRNTGWICTASGRQVRPLALSPDQIAIEDVAAALSKQCRFGGHCRAFYSVAQHSVHVAALLEGEGPEAALAGLLHDASEAYLVDLPGPIKHAPEMEGYRAAEERLNDAVATAFKLPRPAPASVKAADQAMLAAELRDLMPGAAREALPAGVRPRPARIQPWSPRKAQREFEAAFQRYEALRRSLG